MTGRRAAAAVSPRSAAERGAARACRAGLVAAAIVATYPPLVDATGDLLSEPLGALWLTGALLAVARRRYAVGGVLLAAAVLTRANLLVLIAVVALAAGRRGGPVLAVAALVPVVAWSINVGAPVTTGGGSSLFVGTFLPGDGTLPGAKRALKGETVRFAPELRGRHAKDLPGERVLDAVAAREGGLDRDAALRRQALRNLTTYPREQPVAFAAMVAKKVPRLWLGPSRGGGPRTPAPLRLWHALLVVLAVAGLLRAREKTMLAVLVAFTLFHLIAGAMPRYALPLLPALIATGAAGWFAQPRTTASVRAYSAPLRRASISAGPSVASALRIARRRDASSPASQLATPSPAATAAKPTARSPARSGRDPGLVLDADQAQARVVDDHDQHARAEPHRGLELERAVGHPAVARDRDREPLACRRHGRGHREPHRRQPVGDQEPARLDGAPEPGGGEHVRARVDGGHRIRGQLLAEHFDDPPGGQRAVGRDAQRGQRALAVRVDVGGGPLGEAFGEPGDREREIADPDGLRRTVARAASHARSASGAAYGQGLVNSSTGSRPTVRIASAASSSGASSAPPVTMPAHSG